VQISSNHVHFFISYAVAFLVFALIARWYVWPAIRDRAPVVALTPLLLYACLRVNGLMFVMPGLASPDLPRAFAVPTAYGDLTAVVLALVALTFLRAANALAMPAVWVFNVAGLVDLVWANVATFTASVDPVQLGASYYLAVINVPAMVIVHVMIFVYLLHPHPKGAERPA
jgi:hypothetical protein